MTALEKKRLYHFTNAAAARTILGDRRLKISFSYAVNDPFELKPFCFQNRGNYEAWIKFVQEHSQTQGFLSFSEDFRSPAMWGLYGDRHRGVCLGFDIENFPKDDQELLVKMRYQEEDSFPLLTAEIAQNPRNKPGIMDHVKRTKSRHWEHEKEWRVYVSLAPEEERQKRSGDSDFFTEFEEGLQLKEILLGCYATEKEEDFRALVDPQSGVEVAKVQPSHWAFEMEKPN